MEYFHSRGLDYVIKHDLLETHEQTLKILYRVSDGMFEAHRQKVIHRGLPYKGESMSLLFRHIEGKATPLYRLDKGVDACVSMPVKKMMAVDIDKRFQRMKEVRDTIPSLMELPNEHVDDNPGKIKSGVSARIYQG